MSKERHMALWQEGYKSYIKRKNRHPNDNVLVEVVDMLTKNLRNITRGFSIDQLLKQYGDWDFDFPKEIYGDQWDYYMNYKQDEYVGGNYVILSTFEDAAYYIIFQEIIENADF